MDSFSSLQRRQHARISEAAWHCVEIRACRALLGPTTRQLGGLLPALCSSSGSLGVRRTCSAWTSS